MTVITNPSPPRRSGSKIVKAFLAILLIGGVTIAASIMMADNTPQVAPRETMEGPRVIPQSQPVDAGESAEMAAQLEKALHNGDYVAADQLLDALIAGDKRVEAVDRFQLLTAVRLNRLETVRKMLKVGIDAGAVDNSAGAGNKATHLAATLDEPQMIALLIEEGEMKPDELNGVGKTPLHVAAEFGKLRVVEKLVTDLKADVNLNDGGGNTALHIAAREGHREVVQALIKAGADPGLKNGKDQTAYDVAADQDVKTLVQ
jgi:ankyrin repeat protein